jgi:hypothetical protein
MTLALRETAPGYGAQRRLLEADLWRIWEGQRFPKTALVTQAGEELRVIFRGRPGLGPGPDFRGAIIAAPGGLLTGDVELHVRTSDFRRHGHGDDPAYANVALHVVFFHDEPFLETALPGGGVAPVLALGGPRTAAWLERPARWGEPCRDAVERMSAAGLAQTLDRLGAMRFRQKVAAWHKRLAAGEPLEDVLWSGVLEALAYGGERIAFRRLAAELPWAALRPELLAAGGRRLGADEDGRGLTRIDRGFNESVASQLKTQNSQLGSLALCLLRVGYARLDVTPTRPARPGNGGEKRLAGAAALAARFSGPGLAAALIGPLAEEGAAREIVGALTVPGLVGRARAIEIAGNAIMPFAAALCGEPEASRIEGVFAELPQPARYGSVRHLHTVTSGHVKPSMRRQQGMLYLLGQYCTQGGCGKCPLS